FPPRKRYIPGLGTSRRPELADATVLDDIVVVPEAETIAMCHWLLDRHGWLLGGSTGTVLAGVRRWAKHIAAGSTVVTISADRAHHRVAGPPRRGEPGQRAQVDRQLSRQRGQRTAAGLGGAAAERRGHRVSVRVHRERDHQRGPHRRFGHPRSPRLARWPA